MTLFFNYTFFLLSSFEFMIYWTCLLLALIFCCLSPRPSFIYLPPTLFKWFLKTSLMKLQWKWGYVILCNLLRPTLLLSMYPHPFWIISRNAFDEGAMKVRLIILCNSRPALLYLSIPPIFLKLFLETPFMKLQWKWGYVILCNFLPTLVFYLSTPFPLLNDFWKRSW